MTAVSVLKQPQERKKYVESSEKMSVSQMIKVYSSTGDDSFFLDIIIIVIQIKWLVTEHHSWKYHWILLIIFILLWCIQSKGRIK